ncbi:MAG: hypothetical protein K2L12_01680 [Clostridia bacterium]|nr:hypothetical protein [Clostridia bacterium]
MKIVNFIFDIFNVFTKAKQIRQDGERREKSVMFAISSIVYSLIAVAAVLLGSFLMSVQDGAGILIIFVVVIVIGFFAGAIVTFIGALLRVIAQFTLNLKPMTWIALVVLLLAALVSVIIILNFNY